MLQPDYSVWGDLKSWISQAGGASVTTKGITFSRAPKKIRGTCICLCTSICFAYALIDKSVVGESGYSLHRGCWGPA